MKIEFEYPFSMPRSIILPVCGGSAEMNGKPFLAYVGEAAKQFDNAHIILADTLDAHNMVSDPGLFDEALITARALGDRWLRKHFQHIYEAFSGKVTLTRWDSVKEDHSFEEKYELVCRLYQESPKIRQWMEGVCQDYVDVAVHRAAEKGLIIDQDKKLAQSINYMLEETAGSSVYYSWYKTAALYPGQYFPSSCFFNQNNYIAPWTDLSVPPHIRVSSILKIAA